jgi:hypothetical protein
MGSFGRPTFDQRFDLTEPISTPDLHVKTSIDVAAQLLLLRLLH